MTSAYMHIISLTPLAGTECGNMSVWGQTKRLGVHTMAEWTRQPPVPENAYHYNHVQMDSCGPEAGVMTCRCT